MPRPGPNYFIEDGITDAYHEIRSSFLSEKGLDTSEWYVVDTTYDPGVTNTNNMHVVELDDVVSSFFAREVGNPLPEEGMAVDRRLSLLTQAMIFDFYDSGVLGQ